MRTQSNASNITFNFNTLFQYRPEFAYTLCPKGKNRDKYENFKESFKDYPTCFYKFSTALQMSFRL